MNFAYGFDTSPDPLLAFFILTTVLIFLGVPIAIMYALYFAAQRQKSARVRDALKLSILGLAALWTLSLIAGNPIGLLFGLLILFPVAAAFMIKLESNSEMNQKRIKILLTVAGVSTGILFVLLFLLSAGVIF